MPIRPENLARYPKDWAAIAAGIRERAGHRCEWPGCGARNYSVGVWLQDDAGAWKWSPHWGQNDNPRTFSEARQIAAELYASWGEEALKPIVIVLTVAHLNHQPEDCRPENLAAWCQRHHLAYDHATHQANAQATRRARVGQGELF